MEKEKLVNIILEAATGEYSDRRESAEGIADAVMKAYEEEPSRLVAQLDVSDKVFEAIHEMEKKALEMRDESLKKRTEDILNALINMLRLREVLKNPQREDRIYPSTVLHAIEVIGAVFGIKIIAGEIVDEAT